MLNMLLLNMNSESTEMQNVAQSHPVEQKGLLTSYFSSLVTFQCRLGFILPSRRHLVHDYRVKLSMINFRHMEAGRRKITCRVELGLWLIDETQAYRFYLCLFRFSAMLRLVRLPCLNDFYRQHLDLWHCGDLTVCLGPAPNPLSAGT